MHDLVDLFDSLGRPARDGEGLVFIGAAIPGSPHRIAKSEDGQPAILLATEGRGHLGTPPFALEHLHIKHGTRCRVQIEAEAPAQESTFSIVQCVRGDRALQLHFLRAVGAALLALGPVPTNEQLSESLNALVALFRAMSNLPRKSVQGLWGELFVIAEALEPPELVRRWHTSSGELFDFAAGPARLEVKTAADPIRQHYFRLEQLQRADVEIAVASLLVSPSGAGTSAHDLLTEIYSVLREPDLALHVERVVADTLGAQWTTAFSGRFDRELARASLAFFRASDVPAPRCTVPSTVTDIRFRSDLTNVPSWVAPKDTDRLFQAAMQRRR